MNNIRKKAFTLISNKNDRKQKHKKGKLGK